MPFRAWVFCCNIATPLFVMWGIALTFHDRTGLSLWAYWAISLIVWTLGITGAILGLMKAVGRLKMRCPFCGHRGDMGFRRRDGTQMYMDCPKCGRIETTGRLLWRIPRPTE
jgi:hypothetical protein